MRAPATALFLCCLAAPALAAAPPQPSSGKAGVPGTNVEMPFLMAPLSGSDGKLSGYAYISTRLTAASTAGALDVRDKIAFVQDAFVRDVNGASIAKASDPVAVDNPALEARLLADARRVLGSGKVAAITIVQLQVAPLHPNPAITPATTPPPETASAALAADKPVKTP
jgi:hypothetical protein